MPECQMCLDPWNCPVCVPGKPGVKAARRRTMPQPAPQLELDYTDA